MKKVSAFGILGFMLVMIVMLIGVSFNSSDNIDASQNDETTTSDYIDTYTFDDFSKIGREFNTVIRIYDYDFDVNEKYGSVFVKNKYGHTQGYYFEYPYRADVQIVSDVTVDLSNWINDFCFIPDDNNYVEFYFDDLEHTIVMDSNENQERLIIEEIIGMNDTGAIFKGKIDRYAYEWDESDLYFFAADFEDLINLRSYEHGQVVSNVGYPDREIFF